MSDTYSNQIIFATVERVDDAVNLLHRGFPVDDDDGRSVAFSHKLGNGSLTLQSHKVLV